MFFIFMIKCFLLLLMHLAHFVAQIILFVGVHSLLFFTQDFFHPIGLKSGSVFKGCFTGFVIVSPNSRIN